VRVKLVAGSLRIAETNGTRLGLPADEVEFDFATLAEPARVVLQPPGPNPADPAARAAYSTRLAGLSLRLGRLKITDDAVAKKLAEYEETLRPSTWSPSDRVFRGSRAPRRGAPIKGMDVPGIELRDLRAIFDALQSLSIAPGSPPIRPGEAIVLWVMEGRLALGGDNLLEPGEATDFFPLSSGSIPGFPFGPVTFEAAPDSEVRTLLRSQLLWDAWGMDAFTATAFVPAAQDTRLSWEASLPASVAAHDTKLRSGLQAITAAGITPPTEGAINATIELTRSGGVRRLRLLPDYIRITLWLQHAEYLRRQVAYLQPANTAPYPAMPVTARNSPAFNYIAYNGGIKRAADLWQMADKVLTGGPPAWVKTHEDALRSWQLDLDEMQRTPRGGVDRSTAARVNGVHFAALVRTYGAIFPRVLYP
jgi:hypothetical protein